MCCSIYRYKARYKHLGGRARVLSSRGPDFIHVPAPSCHPPGNHASSAFSTLVVPLSQETQRAPGTRGLPVKTLDGQVVFQFPKQRKDLRGGAPATDGDDADRAADPSALLPLASMMPLRVVGVTIEDDLEEHRMAALEAGRQAAAEEARAAREHKVAEHTRREEETEGAQPPGGGGEG